MGCTVVSFLPYPLRENKPGLYPGEYLINKSPSKSIPSVLVVYDAVNPTYIDKDRGTLRLVIVAREVARSIVEDYRNSLIGVRVGIAEPGLFWIDGDHTADEVLIKYKEAVKDALEKQKTWFEDLIRIADDDWSRTGQHKLITKLQIRAAEWMDVKKDWTGIIPISQQNLIDCPVCKSSVKIGAIVCPMCRTILDEEKYKKWKVAG